MVFPTVKNMIGNRIAEIIVIQVRVSIAAKTDVSELTHASKMFFVSFIGLFLAASFQLLAAGWQLAASS